RSRTNRLDPGHRAIVLRQIEQWEQDGLIETERAEVIRSRYNFDVKPAPSGPSPAPVIETTDAPPPPIPAGPPPSLTQTLLSEASIKIYLYLGAFFVIAAALILAAVVEAARLPILVVATLAFGGAALLLQKRLPQPGFALFIVFSFLLLIDANVLEETIGLAEPGLSIYWTVVLLLMAGIWSFSIWFYDSRFFSAVAFGSLSLAFYRFAAIFDTEAELYIFLGLLASLAGLAGASLLRKWKSREFSLFVFWLAQLQALGLLLVSAALTIFHTFDSDLHDGWWLLIALTWVAAAIFYFYSDLLQPGFVFHWMAAAALMPLPWFVLKPVEASQAGYAFGFWGLGAVFALFSELTGKDGRYHKPLLYGSVPLFLTSAVLALSGENPLVAFTVFALTALLYAALHILRRRWYVWSAALLAGLAAFFNFFQLPAIKALEIPYVYQFLIACLVLLVPELFAGTPLSWKETTRWPAVLLGIIVLLPGVGLALVELDHAGRSAIVLIVYAILFTLHGLQSKQEWLGYFAAALESLAVLYALEHFDLDLWLPALTMLALLYYAGGFFMRRSADAMKPWGQVLVDSGLILGLLVSIVSLVLFKETSGWYIALIALLFMVEVFSRPLGWLELLVESLLTISLFLILRDFETTEIGPFLFGASLVWLGGDLIFGRLIQEKRLHRPVTQGAGFALAFFASAAIWSQFEPVPAAIYFSIYALFFAFYAFVRREPDLGYFAAGFLPLAVIQFCAALDFEKWVFPLIAVALVYYVTGFRMRRSEKADEWDRTLLNSGLALGALTSLAAPFQGGLAASIPVAIAATLFASEALDRRNAWWALPANALYLLSYFMILVELDVDEPQFYSIGAALLGMLMHYLLTRAGSKTGAFIAGMLSQMVLLGTTYIQMLSTERLSFFFVLFAQSMAVLVYGLIQRSRSLVITPIVFAVVGVVTVVYSALKGLGPVILIGSTGVLLLMAGIVAVLMRERITKLGEQLSDWRP
ncbi:MAG TPA: hypothetical protein VFY26_07400, partial [Anaerolineales bacterium]|nr:hypothetical protein [Anaerolineales bacterium]